MAAEEQVLETLIATYDRGVATLMLNRPDRMNAVNRQMHADLRTCLDRIETDAFVRCVVVTGTGRAFCSGQDLTEELDPGPHGVPDLAPALDRDYNPLIRRLTALPKPVIAAVNGTAAGAGANLALACDIVLAARSAVFIEAFCRIGLVPDVGGTWMLPRIVGRQRALAMMLTGDPVDATTAKDWGMVWSVLEDEALTDAASVLAQRLAHGPTTALGLTKKAVTLSADQDLSSHLDTERDLQQEAGRHPDFAEGITAFLQKRPPEFTG
jgi:2-(1,2-epoxy-1,2-dihydrophenyl)acetyl-CoA isomerase